MIISQIVAVSGNWVIGKDNRLPWHMPDDLAYFFRLTRNRHVIMGRRNYLANKGPLPKRVNIVVSRNSSFKAPGCIVVHTVDDAIRYAREHGETEAFIIGGGTIYRLTQKLTDRIYLTLIDTEVEGDTFYPKPDLKLWEPVSIEHHPADDRNPYPYTYYIYQRKESDKSLS